MSSSTKIVVLKLKELVIACVLAVLAVILLVLFIIHITSGTRKMPDEASLGTFSPGVYTTSVTLSGNTMELAVTVDSDTVKSIRLVNTAETVETMYPLISSSLEALEKQGERKRKHRRNHLFRRCQIHIPCPYKCHRHGTGQS